MGASADLLNEYVYGQSLVPIARTATGNGNGVDLRSTSSQVTAFHSIGNASSGGTNLTATVKLQESPDNVTFADIVGAVTATVADSGSNQIQVIQAIRTKRYVRAVVTIAGTSPTITSDVTIMAKNISY